MSTEHYPVPRRRRCYLVRHGHVDYFDSHGKPLDPRSVRLSDRGSHQAWALSRALLDTPFDRALCSDYPRAMQTLEVLLIGRAMPTEAKAELREIRAGRLREIAPQDLHEQVVGAYRTAHETDARFLGGERWEDFRQRVLQAFFELAADPSWDTALIVSHDAVNRILLSWATGAGLAGIAAFEQDPACLNILDIDTYGDQVQNAILRTVNFTPYNPQKTGIHDTVMEHLYRGIHSAGPQA
ncbi:histidine phosphatase family protein [Pseudomonas kairouanensis]|uniref:Histidine phosphatase family protein n=1 Tax=Pseudomonas kairouanensis TaxID=2293832 RepID=A0A4Z0ALW9_9PSED|nr:histidine phosphatase family protein [Pseudomonas kairouanensis]TFY87400.1 histidine phosphatase family protein [Pseudomonas kairouanensis]